MSSIQINDVLRLRQTFKTNRWNDIPNEDHVFEQFCHLLENLTEEQKELIHELTERYLWLSSSRYEERFNDLANRIPPNELSTIQTVYLFPILKPQDDQKIKSGTHCIYYFKSLLSLNRNYQNKNIIIVENYTSFQSYTFKADGSEKIFLIDDFIGSGETFESAYSEIRKNISITKNIITVFTLVIQRDALTSIQNLGLDIYSTETRNKGISDSYISPIKESKIKIMEEIEEIFKPQFFSFGYKKSEALVTMMRTPDNTFPVFWMQYKLKGIDFTSPFFRP